MDKKDILIIFGIPILCFVMAYIIAFFNGDLLPLLFAFAAWFWTQLIAIGIYFVLNSVVKVKEVLEK